MVAEKQLRVLRKQTRSRLNEPTRTMKSIEKESRSVISAQVPDYKLEHRATVFEEK